MREADLTMRHPGRAASAVGAAASAVSQHAGAAATYGKTEAAIAWLVTASFAKFADGTLPAEQAIFAWSVCGTVAGAALAGLNMKQAGWLQRVVRSAICCIGGLLLAPWAIAGLPKYGSTPDWWHAFGASGVAAATAWILVDEAGPAIKEFIRDWRKKRKS